MFEVGIYEAKTSFSAIIRRVQQGEECIITHRNKPVVRLSSAGLEGDKTAQEFKKLATSLKRMKVAKNWKAMKEMIGEGRK